MPLPANTRRYETLAAHHNVRITLELRNATDANNIANRANARRYNRRTDSDITANRYDSSSDKRPSNHYAGAKPDQAYDDRRNSDKHIFCAATHLAAAADTIQRWERYKICLRLGGLAQAKSMLSLSH